MTAKQNNTPIPDGGFSTILKIMSVILSPETWLGDDYQNPENNSKVIKIYRILNTSIRFILLIFVLPAVPFLIIFVLMLEALRYFLSKFIHL